MGYRSGQIVRSRNRKDEGREVLSPEERDALRGLRWAILGWRLARYTTAAGAEADVSRQTYTHAVEGRVVLKRIAASLRGAIEKARAAGAGPKVEAARCPTCGQVAR